MNAAQYLDAAKTRLSLTSDYALAKALDIPNKIIPAMRSGKRAVPVHVALKLAITLELDPAEVIVDLESQREKNVTRLELYRSFLTHASKVGRILVCMLFALSVGLMSAHGPLGGLKKRAV